jgi:NTF2 fold immunity protein
LAIGLDFEFGGVGRIIGGRRGRELMKTLAVLSWSLIFATLMFGQGYKPRSGYVPDSATAVQIGEAVLVPIYGKKQIESERPFTARLEGDTWTICGTLRCPDGHGGTTTECDGGVAVVKISRIDARVLYMMHGK